MKDLLRLTLDSDTDGTGCLTAQVSSNGFSGVGRAWFNLSQISTFGAALAITYPLDSDCTYKLQGGTWSKEKPSTLAYVNLSLHFYPADKLGLLGCLVNLADDDHSGKRSATVELFTHYEQLKAFGLALSDLADGKVEEAMLF